jgi:hypothetical protein
MNSRVVSKLGNGELLRNLAALMASERRVTAEVLAYLGEVEARRLYLPAGYSSMFAYCLGELHLSEAAAFKRIRAARAARKFPEIFSAVADGRLHLAGLAVLAKHLTVDNAGELIAAATHKTRAEIEILIARRFPSQDVPARVRPIAPSPAAPPSACTSNQLAPGPVFVTSTGQDSAQVNMIESRPVEHPPTVDAGHRNQRRSQDATPRRARSTSPGTSTAPRARG